MNSVGIAISKGKCMMAALRPMGEVALEPKEYLHTDAGLEQLATVILSLGEETKVVMEATGRYHEPVAAALYRYGIFVSVLNPILIHQSGGGSIRKVKTDKKDSLKNAKFGLDNWTKLVEFTPVDSVRQQLKLFSRQYNLYQKSIVSFTNNLISLTDKVIPGVNELFTSPEKSNGHLKWVDFVIAFWHCDCVCGISENAFVERYRKWCKRNHYNFSLEKAKDIYAKSCGQAVTLPQNSNTRLLITTAAKELTSAKEQLALVKAEIIRLASSLPEYEAVTSIYGVGEITGAQLMAEIGDIRRFKGRNSLVAFAGLDPVVDQSGKHSSKSNPTTKRGSSHLRKTLYQVVCTYIKRAPADEPVYQFLDKKRSEGKPFYVYMTAAENKFLRIYYARVKEFISQQS